MSLRDDPAAVVILPPGVNADEVEVLVVDENDVYKMARRMTETSGKKIKRIVEKRRDPHSLVEAVVVETE